MKSRRRWWMIIPVIAICIVIAGGALYLYVAGTFFECETAVRRTIPSPNGKKSLVVFGRDCGATTGFNTQLSIAPADRPFSLEKDPAFFLTSGLHDVTARWLGENAVEIAGDLGGGKIFRSEPNVGDVKVVYK